MHVKILNGFAFSVKESIYIHVKSGQPDNNEDNKGRNFERMVKFWCVEKSD